MNQFFSRDDAGRGHVESGDASDVRFARADFGSPNNSKPLDAVIFTALLQGGEFAFLVRISCDNDLPRVAEGNIVFSAKFVRKAVALDAVARLQRILRVVDAGVIYAAVAPAGGHDELLKLLNKNSVLPALREGVVDNEAHVASADNLDTCVI